MADTPNIRFKGFTDNWELRKLIDVCDYVDYRGKTPIKTEIGIFLVTAKNIRDGYIDYESSKEYISEDDYEEVMHRGKPEIGDVLITTEAPCGNIAQVDKENIALAQRIIKYRGHSNVVDNTYLKYYLLSPEFQKVLGAKSSGGTVQGIKGSILHQQTIQYPFYEEQVKIGKYMNNLDTFITIHKCKCNETKELKKYMLQKMFPQNGKKIPEIRLAGYTGDWKQHKLSEIVEVLDGDRGKNYPTDADFYKREHTLFLNAANVTTSGFIFDDCQYITETKSNSMGKGKLELDDIILTSRGSLGHIAWYNADFLRIIPFARINSGMLILRNKADVDTSYLYQFLKSDKGQNQISFISFGSAQPQLTKKGVENLEIIFPKEKEEQREIGKYFSCLDHLITLHQRKLEELKEVKKFMLQNMFPQKG